MILPPDLLKAINRGRCFALVGSGPSCEVGYPSWEQLAFGVYTTLASMGKVDDDESYKMFLGKGDYPELFQLAEYDAGGRNRLIEVLKPLLKAPSPAIPGHIYDYLTKWPFACYLTTNYDNEIVTRLETLGVHYTAIQNTVTDLSVIREGVSSLVVKLHSDLEHPGNMVITAADYKKLSVDDSGNYFRARLRSVMETFDVLIVGHSLSDIQFRLILQAAQQTGSPRHPVYMIATGFSKADERLFFQNYRIVLIRYDNADGKHTQLKRLLATHDRFVGHRDDRSDRMTLRPDAGADVEAATALFLYQKLSGSTAPRDSVDIFLRPLIINSLRDAATSLSVEELVEREPLKSLAAANKEAFRSQVEIAASALRTDGLIEGGASISLTPKGSLQASEVSKLRDVLKDQALGQFVATFRKLAPSVTSSDEAKATSLLETVLVNSFEKRGTAIANALFSGQEVGHDDLSDIFGVIFKGASQLSTEDAKISFVDAVHEFLIYPTAPQSEYLLALSQGFFLHHLLGLDPTCSRIRLDIFKSTMWFCDASILIPLLANGCYNQAFSEKLFSMLKERGARPRVTRQMLVEVFEHLEWAVRFVRNNPTVTMSFLSAALVMPGYKQNLFLDGYIRLSADGVVSGFDEYLDLVSPNKLALGTLANRLSQYGIIITAMEVYEGFDSTDRERARELFDQIKVERVAGDSYHSEDQVSAEAEVLHVIQSLRAGKYRSGSGTGHDHFYFISQSTVLNRVSMGGTVTTWSPEAVYRYLTALPGQPPDPDLLQQCMLYQYFQAGISFIDRKRYQKFFGGAIATAKASFPEQKAKYIAALEDVSGTELENQFQNTPDLEKPLFVARLNLRSVEAAKAVADTALEQVTQLKARVKQLEAEKQKKWRVKAKTIKKDSAPRKRVYPAKRKRKAKGKK